MREFKILRISNTSIEILLFLKFCIWIKKSKIVRAKENECKEKRRYDWCASKEKNIDGHGESQGNRDTAAYTTTPDHNIQSMTQGMTHALHAD